MIFAFFVFATKINPRMRYPSLSWQPRLVLGDILPSLSWRPGLALDDVFVFVLFFVVETKIALDDILPSLSWKPRLALDDTSLLC